MLQRAGFPAALLEQSTMSSSEDESGINDFAPGLSLARALHAVCIRNVLKKSPHRAFNDLSARNEEQTFEKYVRLQR